jgi:hypothetical protein
MSSNGVILKMSVSNPKIAKLQSVSEEIGVAIFCPPNN